MKLADGVEMLEITANFMGRQTVIYPVIISDKDGLVLVDTGFPGLDGIAQIREQALKAGMPFRKTKDNHNPSDMDHIGGLPELIRQAARKVEVFCHGEEKPYIEGTKRLIKLTPERMAAIEALPEDQQRQLKSMYKNPPKAPVDRIVGDGEELPCAGELLSSIRRDTHPDTSACTSTQQDPDCRRRYERGRRQPDGRVPIQPGHELREGVAEETDPI